MALLVDLWPLPTCIVLLCGPDNVIPSEIPCFDRFLNASFHSPLPAPSSPIWTLRDGSFSSLGFLNSSLSGWIRHPCVLCGSGDNSGLPRIGSSIPATPFNTELSSPFLWAGTRQFVHERGGLPSPTLSLLPPMTDDSLLVTKLLTDRAFSLIPSAFRPSHIPISTSTYLFRLTIEHEGFPYFTALPPVLINQSPLISSWPPFPPLAPLQCVDHND